MIKLKKYKITAFIIIFTLLTSLLTFNLTVSATQLPVYLSLGDSIAAGYGLTNPTTDDYANLLANGRYNLADFAVSGYTSTDLLNQISDASNKTLQSALSTASLVTVSIGGNNFLQPLTGLVKNQDLSSIMANYSTSNPPDPNSISQSDISSMLSIFTKYFTPGTDEYTQFTAALDKGLTQFSSDLDKIINILSANKKANIVFLTVYNPYKNFDYIIPGLGTMSEDYIGKLNKIITDKSNGNYIVADVYTAFKNSTQAVVNTDMMSMNMDVHPNASGHKLIYKTVAHSLGLSVYFSDMASDAWAAGYVDSLYDLGIMFGTDTQKQEFSPETELKNCDLAVLLVRTLKLKITDSDVAGVNLPFSDMGNIPSYALNSVKACYKSGLYSQLFSAGKTYEFAPQNSAKRIDVALMVAQIIDKSKWSNKNLVYTDLTGVDTAYYPALSTLYDYGIMTGSPDKTLNPFGGLTRAQVAKILYTILNNPALSGK
ncbi:MAG: S-layer homology domain-containing protein [Oscillospiraceae bacterium]|nr:S-layer homology domain-containing protein [Oscillospiraceae bacterium]